MQMELIQNVTNDGEWLIATDDTMRETCSHGSGSFPFQCYREFFDWKRNMEDIRQHTGNT